MTRYGKANMWKLGGGVIGLIVFIGLFNMEDAFSFIFVAVIGIIAIYSTFINAMYINNTTLKIHYFITTKIQLKDITSIKMKKFFLRGRSHRMFWYSSKNNPDLMKGLEITTKKGKIYRIYKLGTFERYKEFLNELEQQSGKKIQGK